MLTSNYKGPSNSFGLPKTPSWSQSPRKQVKPPLAARQGITPMSTNQATSLLGAAVRQKYGMAPQGETPEQTYMKALQGAQPVARPQMPLSTPGYQPEMPQPGMTQTQYAPTQQGRPSFTRKPEFPPAQEPPRNLELMGRLQEQVGNVRNVGTGNLSPAQQERMRAIEEESNAERAAQIAQWQARRGRGEMMGMSTDDSYANAMNSQADAMAKRTDSVGATLRGEYSTVPYEARNNPGPLAGEAANFRAMNERAAAERTSADQNWNAKMDRYQEMLARNAEMPQAERPAMSSEERANRVGAIQEKLQGRREALTNMAERRDQQMAAQNAYQMAMQQLAMVPIDQRAQFAEANAQRDVGLARVNAELQGQALEGQLAVEQEERAKKSEQRNNFNDYYSRVIIPELMTAPNKAARDAKEREMIRMYPGVVPEEMMARTSANPTADAAQQVMEGATEETPPAENYRRAGQSLGADATPEEINRAAAAAGPQNDLTNQDNAEKELRRLMEQYQERALEASKNWSGPTPPSDAYNAVMGELVDKDKAAVEMIKKTLGDKRYREIEREFPKPVSRYRSGGLLDPLFKLPPSIRDLPQTLGLR